MANFSDHHVVLLERTVKANEEVLEENRRLREQLSKRDEAHSKVMQDVLGELKELRQQQSLTPGSRRRHQTRGSRSQGIQVSPLCRRTLRKVYNTLLKKNRDFPGFDLENSVDSPNNQEILQRVKNEMHHYVGGPERCQWSDAEIEGAFGRYFLSSFETANKKKNGKYEEHKRKCRRQGRMREKVTKRTLALETVAWTTAAKGSMAEVLKEEYMSSEESQYETDSEASATLVRYRVKELSWESAKLSRRKAKLDHEYNNAQTKRSRSSQIERVRVGVEFSRRPCPENCPQWAKESTN